MIMNDTPTSCFRSGNFGSQSPRSRGLRSLMGSMVPSSKPGQHDLIYLRPVFVPKPRCPRLPSLGCLLASNFFLSCHPYCVLLTHSLSAALRSGQHQSSKRLRSDRIGGSTATKYPSAGWFRIWLPSMQ